MANARFRRLPLLAVTALCLAAVSVVVVTTTSSRGASPDTVVVPASADAWVTAARPNAVHGDTAWVLTDGAPQRLGYYRFDVTVPADRTVTSAQFQCLPGSSNRYGAGVWAVTGAWDEQTLSWSNAPLPDTSTAPIGTTGPVESGAWASVDVTSTVGGSGSYTFVTGTDSPVAWSCASRENGANAPAELVLTTTPAPVGSSPAPPSTPPTSSPPPPSSTPPSSTPPSSTPPPTTAPPTTPPPPTAAGHKVMVILLENHSQSQALAQMPHLSSWATTYGSATDYHAIAHPSLPNYLAIWGGSTFGVTDDCSVSASCSGGAPSVWGQTLAAGGTAKAYQESMQTDCQTGDSGGYAPRHGPWPYWIDSTERSACQANDVPSGTPAGGPLAADIAAGTLPVTGELTPNLCNDAHDCSLSTADSWLAGWVPALMAGPDYTSGRLTILITFDEDDSSQGNTVAFVAIDPRLSGVTVTARYDHYSLTRWLDDNAGVARLRNAATAGDLRSAFGL
jgi:acid phosphatase